MHAQEEREAASLGSPLLREQQHAFEQLMARQTEVVSQFENALGTGWRRYLFGRSQWQRIRRTARELAELQAALLEAGAALSRTALRVSGETSAVVHLSAEEYDGMRRQLERPDPEQAKRVRAFVARTPSPPRA